jgi:hypothetical protein
MATIRVTEETWLALRELAHTRGESIQEVVAKAVEAYRRQQLLETINAAYATIQEHLEEWQRLQNEYADWDTALLGGLKDA